MRVLVGLICLAVVSPAVACGVSEVCSDTASSLTGAIIFEGLVPVGVNLSWNSDAEDPGLGNGSMSAYRVHRRVGSNWSPVAVVYAAGTCSASQPYALRDAGPADEYAVEVWAEGAGSAACTAYATPQ